MTDVIRAWLLVAHTYLSALRRLAQAASAAGEGEGEAPLPAGAVCGGVRSRSYGSGQPRLRSGSVVTTQQRSA